MDAVPQIGAQDRLATRRSVQLLLTPSWVSGLVCILAALALVVAVVTIQRYHGSTIEQQVAVWQTPSSPEAAYEAAFNAAYGTTRWQALGAGISTGLFWSFFGLVIYSLVFGTYDLYRTTKNFKAELNYVHVDRSNMVHAAVVRLVVRLLALGAWFAYAFFFFRVLVPYALTAAQLAGNPSSPLIQAVVYGSGAVVAVVLGMHMHVILLRTLLLRRRLFGD